jgi:hypothetical protein
LEDWPFLLHWHLPPTLYNSEETKTVSICRGWQTEGTLGVKRRKKRRKMKI